MARIPRPRSTRLEAKPMTDTSLSAAGLPHDAARQVDPAADPSILGLLIGLWRRKFWVVVPTVLVTLATLVFLFLVTPQYRAETQILIEPQETAFTRPDGDATAGQGAFDNEAVRSQVQVILSVDLARQVIRDLDLADEPEFGEAGQRRSLLSLLRGLISGDGEEARNVDRLLQDYYDRLRVYPISDSRVIAISFDSADPVLAAAVANAVAEGYIDLQRTARRDTTREATDWLSDQIDVLRARVAEAERAVETFRASTGLFQVVRGQDVSGTLIDQRLSEISSQITQARASRADAEARARLIRDLLASGQSLESSDVLNSPLIQSLFEEQLRLRAQIAELSSTFLSNHPRMRELTAQLVDLDRQMRAETERIVRGLENEAAVAAARERELTEALDQIKLEAVEANGQEVELRALEREARAERDLLETYLARFRDASARNSLDAAPADARIVSAATVPTKPFFPKKTATLMAAIVATVLVSAAIAIAHELATVYARQNAAMRHAMQPVSGRDEAGSIMAADRAAPGIDLDESVDPTGRIDPDPLEMPAEALAGASPVEADGVDRDIDDHRAPHEDDDDGAGDHADDAVDELEKESANDTGAPLMHRFGRLRDLVAEARSPGGVVICVAPVKSDMAAAHVGLAAAAALSADGHRVVLVDTDTDHNAVSRLAGSEPGAPGLDASPDQKDRPGLGDLIEGRARFEDVLHRLPGSRVHALSAGRCFGNRERLLMGDDFAEIIAALTQTYDVVVMVGTALSRSVASQHLATLARIGLTAHDDLDGARARARATQLFAEAGTRELIEVDATALQQALETVPAG